MAIDLRDQVFELRRQDPPVSWSKIAEQLGISRSRAQRLFNRKATPASSSPVTSTPMPPAWHPAVDASLPVDPSIADARRRLELRRIADAEQDLELRSLERQRRLQLMQGGGDGAATAMLMSQIDRLERKLEDRPGAQREREPSLLDQLNDLSKLSDVVQKFAPPASPSASADLEWRVRLAALDREDRRLMEQHEKELALRQREADSTLMRNNAIAQFVEAFGPTITKLAEKFVEDRTAPAQSQQLAIQHAGTMVPMQQRASSPIEVEGECPVCRTPIGKSSAEPEKCPGCGEWLTIRDGQLAVVDDQGGAVTSTGQQDSSAPALRIQPMQPVAS